MNLRDLHYLTTVADTLHFGRAAERCNVSQPTLSMQLKKLEETLGIQLFERSNKEVRLTPMGAEIAARAQRVLSEVEQMKLAAKAAQDPESGTLTLGIFPTLAPYLLPLLMPQLTARFPRLTIQLVEEKTPELVTRLESGKIDVAMLAIPVVHSGFTHARLFDEPFLLAVSRGHALAKRSGVTLEDIRKQRLLLLEDGHCLRDQALEVCQLTGMQESTFRATSLETLRHMVAASDAVTLMPKLATREDDPELAYVPFRKPAPHRTIGLYWRQASAQAKLFGAIAALVSEAYAKA